MGPGDVARIAARYASKHPKLISREVTTYPDGSQVLEVFAYYKGQSLVTDADTGTSLRFIESAGGPDGRPEDAFYCVLPGMTATDRSKTVWSPAVLDFPGWCDHWVSNVVSREGFLQTLHDGLGFTPQVEFNAGVVAAGEARIESTVTGNKSGMKTTDPKFALTNMNQIYLPINNALSEVGHVHWFLEEIGQGVQHVATRVGDIIGFIQKVNDMRRMTNLGFTFLNIPRSYYGVLRMRLWPREWGDSAQASAIKSKLLAAGVIDVNGIVVVP